MSSFFFSSLNPNHGSLQKGWSFSYVQHTKNVSKIGLDEPGNMEVPGVNWVRVGQWNALGIRNEKGRQVSPECQSFIQGNRDRSQQPMGRRGKRNI
jgi:hypothetical protein